MIYRHIPYYFKESGLYRSFNTNEMDEDIDIPEEFTYYPSVESVKDLTKVLKISQFWQLDKIPDSVYEFLNSENIIDGLIYLSENVTPKIQESLKELISSINPENDVQIYFFLFNIQKIKFKIGFNL